MENGCSSCTSRAASNRLFPPRRAPAWASDAYMLRLQAAYAEISRSQGPKDEMKAAQTGGSSGLGPSAMDQAAIKQRGGIQQQSDTAGAQTAAQAQAQQSPQNAPPAPSGPQGCPTGSRRWR